MEEISIFQKLNDYREEFERLLALAIQDGLIEVKKYLTNKFYIDKHYRYTNLEYKENGLPSLSPSLSDDSSPLDYSSCFNNNYNDNTINEMNIETFRNLLSYVKENENLSTRLHLNDDFLNITLRTIYTHCIDRYININKTTYIHKEKIKNIIDPVVNYIFNEKLSIDIAIPILFVTFDFDYFKVADDVEIRRIDDKLHLARYDVKSYDTSTHESVSDSATHALYLKNYEVQNSEKLYGLDALHNKNAYPLSLISNFLGAMRIVTEIETGYAQLLSVSNNWCLYYKADLPNVSGTCVRAYPSWFENFYWNIDSSNAISSKTMNEIVKIYNEITNAKEKSIELALNRLNQCKIRENEEDIILDITIALEALFSDDGNQEMTHKLAMRIAGIAKIFPGFNKTPQQIFSDIKNIYSYRSAIVHGSKNTLKNRLIKINEKDEIPTNILALEYLRLCLLFLLKNPKYRDSKVIDNEILLGNI